MEEVLLRPVGKFVVTVMWDVQGKFHDDTFLCCLESMVFSLVFQLVQKLDLIRIADHICNAISVVKNAPSVRQKNVDQIVKQKKFEHEPSIDKDGSIVK